MKTVCVFLLCMTAVAFAFILDLKEDLAMPIEDRDLQHYPMQYKDADMPMAIEDRDLQHYPMQYKDADMPMPVQDRDTMQDTFLGADVPELDFAEESAIKDRDIVPSPNVAKRNTKKLNGGLTFITTSNGKGQYKCECYRGKKKIYAGVCGVTDKSFDYNQCY